MPDETPAAATQQTSPTPPTPPAAQVPQTLHLNPANLVAEIDKVIREDYPDDHTPIAELPRGIRFVWGWIPDTDGNMGLINVGQPWPYEKSKSMTVVAMFHDDAEVRIYALPTQLHREGQGLSPTRYTLAKNAPAIFGETMPLPAFKGELESEYKTLMGIDDDEEPDDPEPEPKPNGETPKTS